VPAGAFPYGLPGYDGIPAAPASGAAASGPSSTAPAVILLVSLSPSSMSPVPIHQIQFPHSPSPVPPHVLPPSLEAACGGANHLPSGTSVPGFHRLDFPHFDGKEDPLGWLNQCEQFFRGQRTQEADKVWLATYHLRDAARTWYYALERDAGAPTWEHFKDLCNQRFGPPSAANTWASLRVSSFARTSRSTRNASWRSCAMLCLDLGQPDSSS
jgi:hypothetical protein